MKKKILFILMSVALLSTILCGCGDNAAKPSDPTKLIIGSWSNEEAGIVTQFKEDGTYTTSQNGEIILADEYTTEKIDNSSITLTTGEGETVEITFVDENTIKSEDATLIRVTQNEYIPEEKNAEDNSASPVELVIGTWVLDNSSMEFDENGNVYINEDGESSTYTYMISSIDDSSMTITLIDIDGTTSSETAVFYDHDTLTIGDSTFSRAQ